MTRIVIYRSLSIIICMLTLSACQHGLSTSGSTYNGPTIIQHPQRVLNGALGLSFETSINEAKELGFKDLTDLSLKHIGLWRKERNPQVNGFWGQKQLTFTPMSGKVSRIAGSHFYKKDNFANQPECLEDFRITSGKLKTKYPTLMDTSIYSVPMPEGYHSKSWCEGAKKYSFSQDLSGLGRCVYLTCSVQVWTDDTVIGSLLSISYSDPDANEKYKIEKAEYIRNNQDKMLKKKGMSPDEL